MKYKRGYLTNVFKGWLNILGLPEIIIKVCFNSVIIILSRELPSYGYPMIIWAYSLRGSSYNYSVLTAEQFRIGFSSNYRKFEIPAYVGSLNIRSVSPLPVQWPMTQDKSARIYWYGYQTTDSSHSSWSHDSQIFQRAQIIYII